MSKFIVAPPLPEVVDEITEHIQNEMEKRSFQAANELRNSALMVLRGQRSGRRYKVPGTYRRQRDKTDGKMKRGRYYTASAPGESPAVRTGTFRNAWQTKNYSGFGSFISRIENDVQAGGYNLGELLENGTPGGQMAPRPYQDKILDKAKPKIVRIYGQPYF